MSCLDWCRARLDDWNKVEFGHVGKTIADLQKHLEWLERQPMSPKNIQSMKATRVNLNCWLEKEDAMWLQRSRISWLQNDDRNTRFFHEKASSHFRKNFIEGLLDENRQWQGDESKVEGIVVDYYKSLFQSSNPTDFSKILEVVQHKASLTMNQNLTKDFNSCEVSLALKQMYPLKALVLMACLRCSFSTFGQR